MGDVERFRDTVEMFRELDDRFGGGHARDALIRYLQGDAVRLLRGRYPDTVGSALLSAVAEADAAGRVDDVRQHARAARRRSGTSSRRSAWPRRAATGCSARRSWTR